MPAISIITPTGRREELLRLQHRMVLNQSETDFEWLILDDGPEPSEYFTALNDKRIRYHHHTGSGMSIGAKRNWLAERAVSPIISHFDDDDYYAPDYLRTMILRLTSRNADITRLSGWFVYDTVNRKLGYWNTAEVLPMGLHFLFSREGIVPRIWGEEAAKAIKLDEFAYGFNYAYRKELWQALRFADRNHGEDNNFLAAATAAAFRLDHFADSEGICLHVLRHDNMSVCFPQYLIPDFLLEKIFPPEIMRQLVLQS